MAAKSIEDAVERYNDSLKKGGKRKFGFSAQWVAVDCCKPSLQRELDHVDFFDVVSCQFSLHYSFETPDRARSFLANVAYKLRPSGYFIGITPDAKALLKLAQAAADHKTFGNDMYQIAFDEPMESIKNGQRYTFTLQDAVDKVPEYVVDPAVLVDYCKDLDLELKYFTNLQELYYDEIPYDRHGKLAREYAVPMKQAEIDQECWEAAGLYTAFVFKKKGTPATMKHKELFQVRPALPEDIKRLSD